jgi:hypothetical protein
MQYCGLVAAVLEESNPPNINDHDMKSYNALANKVIARLGQRRPKQWYAISTLSFLMVWSQILMASMISYNTPTVGLGCWTSGNLIYGILSSVSWVVQLCVKKPGEHVRAACHVFNFLALSFLITFVILVVRMLHTLSRLHTNPIA